MGLWGGLVGVGGGQGLGGGGWLGVRDFRGGGGVNVRGGGGEPSISRLLCACMIHTDTEIHQSATQQPTAGKYKRV